MTIRRDTTVGKRCGVLGLVLPTPLELSKPVVEAFIVIPKGHVVEPYAEDCWAYRGLLPGLKILKLHSSPKPWSGR